MTVLHGQSCMDRFGTDSLALTVLQKRQTPAQMGRRPLWSDHL